MTSDDPILFKARVMREFRSVLDQEGFVEIVTPVIRRYPNGGLTSRLQLADGRYLRESSAFALRYNLRLADKIFELGPSFRPDAIDDTHLSEFHMLDLYWHGASLKDVELLAERLLRLFYKGHVERISAAQRIREHFDIDLFSDRLGKERLFQCLMVKYPASIGASLTQLLDKYVKEEIEPLSQNRCLIVGEFPVEAEIRAKRTEGTLQVQDRFEFQIAGVEVINGYADEPDPSLLAASAKEQDQFGPEDQLMCNLLMDGAVPAESAGFGIGLERFCQVCLGVDSITRFMPSPMF